MQWGILFPRLSIHSDDMEDQYVFSPVSLSDNRSVAGVRSLRRRKPNDAETDFTHAICHMEFSFLIPPHRFGSASKLSRGVFTKTRSRRVETPLKTSEKKLCIFHAASLMTGRLRFAAISTLAFRLMIVFNSDRQALL